MYEEIKKKIKEKQPYGYVDDETIELAKKHNLEKERIKHAEETKNSLEVKDCKEHRNLQNQVRRKTGYNNRKARNINNEIIHYGDKPHQTLKKFPEFQKKLIKENGLDLNTYKNIYYNFN